eukprot:324628-Chlamydomonas_euryale.AAC.1
MPHGMASSRQAPVPPPPSSHPARRPPRDARPACLLGLALVSARGAGHNAAHTATVATQLCLVGSSA